MSEDILFLLWVFIIPLFTVGRQFFKTVNAHRNQPFAEIIWITLLMAFLWMLMGCAFGWMILGKSLLSFVLGNVFFSGIALLFFGVQEISHPLKKITFVLFCLFNLVTVLKGLLTHSFSDIILVIILLIYPIVSVYQFLLNYIGKESK